MWAWATCDLLQSKLTRKFVDLGLREFLTFSFSSIKLGNNIPKNKLSKNKNLKSQNALKILNKLYTQASGKSDLLW